MTNQQQVDAIVKATYKQVETLISKALERSCYSIVSAGKNTVSFKLENNPELKAKIDRLFADAGIKCSKLITGSIRASWNLANKNMDKMLYSYLYRNPAIRKKISKSLLETIFRRNEASLQKFIERVEEGMNLSNRVWQVTEEAKTELGVLVEEGITVGKSAATLSQDVKKILKQPNKLFRRVKDENGVWQLSKAAKNYHPGQGVYRSSYMNAKRLTSTEINMSYRMSDMERYNQIDFITGYRVVISNNHPKEDICDDLEGEYPKGFVFRGWHPFCRCHTESIMLSESEFIKYLDNGKIPGRRVVENIPDHANDYIKNNMEAFMKLKNTPYFIKDNAGWF